MADVPARKQIHKIWDAWRDTDTTIVYRYDDSEKPKQIGKAIKALADLPVTVLPSS